VGRGVLLDFASYAERNNIVTKPFESSIIPLTLIKEVAREQGVAFRPGDILFIRSGFTKAYEQLSLSEATALGHRPSSDFMGIESGEATLRWLWENQFAAVAGDAVAVESSPVQGAQIPQDYSLHQWCLAGWGMPLGEMFNLEKLAAYCEEKKRWTFFFSSMPLHVGVSFVEFGMR
jgi:kynurenine formamidase